MPTTLIPDWAPNAHPMLVHFPIAWLIAAIAIDVVSLALPRPHWALTTATLLYPAGAASALVTYLTGMQAAAAVLTPGLAHEVVQQHWNWALATTIFFAVLSTVRLVVFFILKRQPSYAARIALTGAAFGGLILLFYTAELGARLVYEYGVGVRG